MGPITRSLRWLFASCLALLVVGCGSTASGDAPAPATNSSEPASGSYTGPAPVALSGTGSSQIQTFLLSGSPAANATYSRTGDRGLDADGITFDNAGSLFVADLARNELRAHGGGEDDGDAAQVFEFDALQISDASALAMSPGDEFIIVDATGNQIVVVSRSGDVRRRWGAHGGEDGEFERPSGVAVDSKGDVYVVDAGNDRVQKFSPTGDYILEIGTSGRNSKRLEAPVAITIDVNDVIYVLDAKLRVATFNTDGLFIGQFGEPETGSGSFVDPVAIVADNCGSVWVADRGNSSLLKFSTHGYLRASVPIDVAPDASLSLASVHEKGSCSNDGA